MNDTQETLNSTFGLLQSLISKSSDRPMACFADKNNSAELQRMLHVRSEVKIQNFEPSLEIMMLMSWERHAFSGIICWDFPREMRLERFQRWFSGAFLALKSGDFILLRHSFDRQQIEPLVRQCGYQIISAGARGIADKQELIHVFRRL